MPERAVATAKAPEAKQKCSNSCKQNMGFNSSGPNADMILQLQRTAGNRAVQKLIKSGALQAKLRIGQPNDVYEQEADRVAEQVVRMPEPQVSNETKAPKKATDNLVQLKCPECKLKKDDEEKILQAKEISDSTPEVTPEMESNVSAIQSGGQPLPDSARAFFETRFGYDFSGVRIHTDSKAVESAREMNARAFTLGKDIVFGEGNCTLETNRSGQLIAHELTHVVQQRTGNHRIQTQKAADEGTKTDREDISVEKQILTALQPNMDALCFKILWDSVEKQIISPSSVKSASKNLKNNFPQLFDDTLITKLNKLSSLERVTAAKNVYNTLIKHLTGLDAEELDTEYNNLSSRIRTNIENGIKGYIAARNGLFATFGNVANMNEYYNLLVPADFPTSSTTIKGSKMLVHPILKNRLQQASKILKKHEQERQDLLEEQVIQIKGFNIQKNRSESKKTWIDLLERQVTQIGGLSIRENRNNPNELSDHSFGCAFDIDAALNPNIKPDSFPKSLVKKFTGIDVYSDEAVKSIDDGGTFEELLPKAYILKESSALFKDIFVSEDSLKDAIANYLKEKDFDITAEKKTTLLDLLETGTKKNAFNKKEIEKLLEGMKQSKSNLKLDKPKTGGNDNKKAGGFNEIISFLLEAYKVFLGTRSAKGKKISPLVFGTKSSIAAHGFLSIPAELIAALTGSDGGNLEWGGTFNTTKDYMHFQLKKADRPIKNSEKKKESPKCKIQ